MNSASLKTLKNKFDEFTTTILTAENRVRQHFWHLQEKLQDFGTDIRDFYGRPFIPVQKIQSGIIEDSICLVYHIVIDNLLKATDYDQQAPWAMVWASISEIFLREPPTRPKGKSRVDYIAQRFIWFFTKRFDALFDSMVRDREAVVRMREIARSRPKKDAKAMIANRAYYQWLKGNLSKAAHTITDGLTSFPSDNEYILDTLQTNFVSHPPAFQQPLRNHDEEFPKWTVEEVTHTILHLDDSSAYGVTCDTPVYYKALVRNSIQSAEDVTNFLNAHNKLINGAPVLHPLINQLMTDLKYVFLSKTQGQSAVLRVDSTRRLPTRLGLKKLESTPSRDSSRVGVDSTRSRLQIDSSRVARKFLFIPMKV